MQLNKGFAVLLLVLSPLFLHATGLGFYFVGNETDKVLDNAGEKLTEEMGGVGLVFMTNVTRSSFAGYHINVERLRGRVKKIDGLNASDNIITRTNMLHTFTFGMIRTEHIRLWAGPRLKASYEEIRATNGSDYENSYAMAMGIAPSAGVNIRFTQDFGMFADLDYHFVEGTSFLGNDNFRERGLNVRVGLNLVFKEY